MKKIFAIIALSFLGIAFVVVSLWVALSGDRSARAVRAKFRIGGAMLTLTAMLSFTACDYGIGGVSCYDPAPPPMNEHKWLNNVANSELRNGDIVMLWFDCRFGDEIVLSLVSDCESDDRVLCSETHKVKSGENELSFVINAGDYRGRAQLCVTYERYDGEGTITFGEVFVSIID